MSDSVSTPTSVPTGGDAQAGTTGAVTHEAEEVRATAVAEAGNLAGKAKDEAATVAREAGTQARDLYDQARRELQDQAAQQQRRVADGLRSVGDELGSMAASSDASGVAADLVQQASSRLSSAATWLSDREPGALVADVKSYARRHPGAFIAAAAVVGVVAGRLTRALGSSDQGVGSPSSSSQAGPTAAAATATTPATPPATSPVAATTPAAGGVNETPLYEAARGTQTREGL